MNSSAARNLYPIALAHFAIELSNNYLPVVYPILIISMGLTYSEVGFAAFVAGAGTTLSQPVFGILSDRWGVRRFIALSVAWCGLLMGLVGLTQSYGMLLVVIGLGALGSAAFHPAGMTAAGSVTSRRRGSALSVFSVGGSLGSATSPLLITAAIGWWGLPATLLLIPIALVIALILYRQLAWTERLGPKRAPRNLEASTAQPAVQAAVQGGSLAALIFVILSVMCRSWIHYSFVTYLPEWLQTQGWTVAQSSQIFTVLVVNIAVGALLGGMLSDRIGRWLILAGSMILLVPAIWLFLGAAGTAQVVLVGFIGIMLGASFPVSIAAAQEAWPRSLGVASGLVSGLGWLPGGMGAAFTGLVADRTSLTAALYLLVIPPVLGLVFALLYAHYRPRAEAARTPAAA